MALQLAFEDTGTGPPVVVLHGLFGSGANWRSVARALAPHHRVLCVDLRNHGHSPWTDSMDYLEMADDVRALIARQGLSRPTVVGHSMGGKTAMALALAQPEALKRLIVVDIAPRSYHDALSSYAQAMRSVDLMAAASRAEVQRQLQALLPDASVARLAERLASNDTSPSGNLVQEEMRARVRGALLSMKEVDREILVLRYLERLSTAEISAVLGIREGAVKVRHFRALERLRALLDEPQVEEPQ